MNRFEIQFAAGALAVAAVLGGCALFSEPPPEPAPRDCTPLPSDALPPLDEVLDPSRLVAGLRARSDDDDELVLSVSVHAEGQQIRIFGGEDEEAATLGPWPILVREALRSPLPPDLSPGFRVRLVPGSEGRVGLEPATYCPPVLRNEDEVVARYREQMADAGVVEAQVEFGLSDLGGIRSLDVAMPDGFEDREILARRALRFARFDPALLDGRRMPATVLLRFPPDV